LSSSDTSANGPAISSADAAITNTSRHSC